GVLIRLFPDSWFVAIVSPLAWVWSKIPKWKRNDESNSENSIRNSNESLAVVV
ncbi:calcium-translocating P-type ATPase, partial [Colletotrichum cuscutae]